MLYINKITANASQQITLTGIPSVTITMHLRFLPRVQQWVADFDDGTIQIYGVSVMCSINLLRQWKNVIPYGISCIRADGLDPYQVTDFADQLANLYLLDAADVATIEAEWFQ